MAKFTKKFIKKNKKTKRFKKSNKSVIPVIPNKGYYKNIKECEENTKKPIVVTNKKFQRFPNIFDQLFYTAGDVADIEKHSYLPLRHLKLKNYTLKKSIDIPKIYKDFNFQAVKNTFNYIFNEQKKSVFVMIKDNKLEVYLPFSNARYRNSDEILKQLYIDDEDKEDLKNFVETTDSNQKKILWQKLTKNVIEKLQPKFSGRLNYNRQFWITNNNCLIKGTFENVEGDRSENVFKDMLEQLCESETVPDSVFFLNKKDFPIIKKNLTYPFDDLMDGEVKLPEEYRKQTYCPIFSSSITDAFADLLMPNEDDWRKVSENFYTDYSSKKACKIHNEPERTDWKDKIEKVIFRGKLTGCGTTYDTNIRLKAAKMGKENPDVLDVGLVDFNRRLKKPKDEPVKVFDPKEFDIQLKNKITDTEKLKFKYILNLDGNVSAFRLGSELSSGSVVLLPDSPYKIWYSDLLEPYKHFVPIKKDLSNLLDQVEWCQENDSKCKKIAENAMKFHEKTFSKKNLLKYFNSKLKEIAAIRSSKFFEKPKTKPDIVIVTIFREDVSGKRTSQKEKFLEIMPKLFEDANLNIIVVEQSEDGRKFNIGKLKNIGFDIAVKQKLKGHVIFTDIDMIPDSNLMKYYLKKPSVPIALAVKGTRYSYGKINENNPPFLGGVVAFNTKDFKKINGYPNNALGWGGEDDMLRNRIHYAGLEIGYPLEGLVIDMEQVSIKTKLMTLKQNNLKENLKYEKIVQDVDTWKTNGLNNLNYTVISKKKTKNIHHYIVNIDTNIDMENNPELFNFENKVLKNVKINNFNLKEVK
ncbi:putative beta-1,4 galactosyltranferase [Aureococcus anophagefferens virus]|uniref:Putative beta-1,4 galactosyltranferase n=1 Tax=Aureococcus anophagefferens virus TaxID=1474867 RepID=A0A076FM45_9VIRU|nr:putative beta-1,4 galactosyltranferase [Aureococcus anophagefferens virus]AII16943.1 putative beta-1,4 galactosyltranferase [Aureococcus anophagefferens virus]UOG94188.1 Glycosyl transferase family 90 [Aureococcus anophagefferens virus]